MEEKTSEMKLIDVHAHLDELEDLSSAIEEAKEAGVQAIIAVGSLLEANQKTLAIAEANLGYVFPAIGYHPWDIKEEEIEANLLFIRHNLSHCVALGEIGLDYKAKVKKELQHRVFNDLLDLAQEFSKPVLIHCRYSHQRTLEMILAKGIKQAVFHWYSGPIELLDEILAHGYFISATPALLYSLNHQEAIKKAPLERILLETDTPVTYQGLESRPKDVRITLEEVAKLKALKVPVVAEQTTINAVRFFHLSQIDF